MSRLVARVRAVSLVASVLAVAGASPSLATPFVVAAGTTDTAAKTLTGAETGTVEATGSLSTSGTSVTLSGASPAPGAVIDNSGTISSSTSRGIDTSGSTTTRNITLNNNEGALLSGSNDGFRINSDVVGGAVVVNNAGTIQSTSSGQAIDFDAIDSDTASVTINNFATGVITAANADAVRPGEGGVVNNYGQITSNATALNPTNDGVDLQGHAGTLNNYTGGVVSGARHGITSDVDVTVFNDEGAAITGRNGSGVGSDGDGTVTNYGTITGAVDGASPNGDGDGVDIDFAGTIINYGVIQGTGAAGPNASEGIAMGGGTIDNYEGALISGADNGILIDDSNGAAAPAAVTILNVGTIQGLDGFGVRIIGTQDDIITNAGIISGTSGSAIDMGGGNDNLHLQSGSSTSGAIEGGDGTDTIHTTGTGTLSSVSSFELLSAEGGSWTLTGAHGYAGGVTVESPGKLVADGATITTPTLQVNADGVFGVQGAGATINGNVVNDGTFQVDNATVTFDGTFTNNGAYVSDPSTQTFDDLVNGTTGYIDAAPGDLFRVGGDFLNHSSQNLLWDTSAATLEFFGAAGTTHTMLLTGLDLGLGIPGFVDNFAWGALVIELGNTLSLGDGLGLGGVAQYVGELIGVVILDGAIANIFGNGFNLYYDTEQLANAYLGGGTYALANGGFLIAASSVPEPMSLALVLPGLGLIAVVLRRRRQERGA
jgi:hypothetical protein